MTSHGYHEDDFDIVEDTYESYAMRRGSPSQVPVHMIQQMTTKVAPFYDGKTSFFAFEDAIDDWRGITELEPEKRGPALRNRLEGEAAVYKRLLDRELLRDPNEGVNYFKRTLRPHFIKSAQTVFLYRFMQFMKFNRGIAQATPGADPHVPVPWNDEMARHVLNQLNHERRERQRRAFPLNANLSALTFVSLADLTQDQRNTLTSTMTHRGRTLDQHNVQELRDLFCLEMFCTTKTAVDNPMVQPSASGQRRSFLVLDEGDLDGTDGYWAEDEEDGAEGFLDALEDVSWVFDDADYTWYQRWFRGRSTRRGTRKGKGKKGRGKGRGGRRYFRPRRSKGKGKGKRRKGKSHMVGEEEYEEGWQEEDWCETNEGYWAEDQTWNDGYWANDDPYYKDEHGYFQRKGKGKGKKGKKGKNEEGKGKPGDG
eukprot:s2970_g4.t1